MRPWSPDTDAGARWRPVGALAQRSRRRDTKPFGSRSRSRRGPRARRAVRPTGSRVLGHRVVRRLASRLATQPRAAAACARGTPPPRRRPSSGSARAAWRSSSGRCGCGSALRLSAARGRPGSADGAAATPHSVMQARQKLWPSVHERGSARPQWQMRQMSSSCTSPANSSRSIPLASMRWLERASCVVNQYGVWPRRIT